MNVRSAASAFVAGSVEHVGWGYINDIGAEPHSSGMVVLLFYHF